MAITIYSVKDGSAAKAAGLQPGDILLEADGKPVNDLLDYGFYTQGDAFELKVSSGGEIRTLKICKTVREFGCDFETYLGDKKHSCDNHCMFCFIDQLPPGMRETLYFKDDDERLSFLFGNYITLTNMHDHEIDRIILMHISPINISVHTTDPALRVRMLANKRGGETLKYLKRLADAGIEINCQIVCCRGVNDGAALEKTLQDLLALGPSVKSIAAVPAGLTRYRQKLYPLQVYDAQSAAETLDILEKWGNVSLQKNGIRVIFPSDEWYLCAGRPIPGDDFYEDYAQLENGVGMWRSFRTEFLAELDRPHRMFGTKAIDVVTGELAGPLMREMAEELHRQYPMVTETVHVIKNDFFGGNVSVAGLITGRDIIAQCSGKLQSGTLGIPDVMLRAEKDLFLDDMTPAMVGEALGVKVEILPTGGTEQARALLKSGIRLSRRGAAKHNP